MEVLITSGGTRIQIDRVRHIANMSRGTFGSEIARCFLQYEKEASVTFLRAEGSRSPMAVNIDMNAMTPTEAIEQVARVVGFQQDNYMRFQEIKYKTFDAYAEHLKFLCTETKPDIIVLAAAVSDYGTKPLKGKVRSGAFELNIKLHKLPKLISKVRGWCPNAFIVGFKLLVDSTDEQLMAAAKDSLKNKIDFVVANDLRDIQNNDHRVMFVDKNGDYEIVSKSTSKSHDSLAHYVVDAIVSAAAQQGTMK
jgi:phosphopantothenate---cysteine ligase (CTP)